MRISTGNDARNAGECGKSAAGQHAAPVYFSETLKCLCVSDPPLIAEIFRSDRFAVVAYAQQLRRIADRTAVDLDASIAAMDNMPLAQEADAHKRLRAEAADAFSQDRRGHREAMDGYIQQLVSHVFLPGAEVDITAHLAVPIFLKTYSLWAGKDMGDVAAERDMSRIFCREMSLNRRKRLNDEVERFAADLAGMGGELAISPNLAMTIAILGADSLVGSLSLSLWQLVSDNVGMPLNQMVYPAELPETGVPYIERIATETTDIGGFVVGEGERVRLILEDTSRRHTGAQHDLFFGRGRHVCLGKPMATAIWRSLASAVAQIPLAATPVEMKMRPRDYVFHFPEYARIRLHA